MKLLRCLLCLACLAFATVSPTRAADDDSVRLLVYKSGDDTAKIMIGERTYLAPIQFEMGFTWADVKDAYHVPPAYASYLRRGRISIYIGCSGAQFSVLAHPAPGLR